MSATETQVGGDHDPIRVAVICGGRDYSDREFAFSFLDRILPQCLIVIEGGATGADRIGRDWAKLRLLHVATVPAQWQAFGKRAGPYRNSAMIKLRPDAVIAFPGGSGTAHMIEATKRAGIRLILAEEFK